MLGKTVMLKRSILLSTGIKGNVRMQALFSHYFIYLFIYSIYIWIAGPLVLPSQSLHLLPERVEAHSGYSTHSHTS